MESEIDNIEELKEEIIDLLEDKSWTQSQIAVKLHGESKSKVQAAQQLTKPKFKPSPIVIESEPKSDQTQTEAHEIVNSYPNYSPCEWTHTKLKRRPTCESKSKP